MTIMPIVFDCHGIIYIHWVPKGQTVNKEYYVEVLREFRKRFRRKRPCRTLSLRTMASAPRQCALPQVASGDELFDRDGNQDRPSPSLQSRFSPLRLLDVPQAEGEAQGSPIRGCRGDAGSCDKCAGLLPSRRLQRSLPEVAGPLQEVRRCGGFLL